MKVLLKTFWNQDRNIMLLPAHTLLYRYDLMKPPTQWSTNFHEYHDKDFGFKNTSGSFFFYDNEGDSICTCKNEQLFEGSGYFTQCKTIRELNLLDIRTECMIRIFDILYENDIDVLTSDFNTYSQGDARPLSAIKEDFEEYLYLVDKQEKTIQDSCTQLNLVNTITNYIEHRRGNESFRYLGQLLTDFDNGPIFKRMLMQKGFDGYVFYENDFNTPCVTTYCIFENTSLSSPNCELIIF